MAFTGPTLVGENNTKTPGTSIDITLTGGVAQGALLVVRVVTDNGSTTQGETTTISATDSQSNTYTRRGEVTKTDGGSGDGTTTAILECVVGTALSTSETITITSSNVVARTAVAEYWTASGTPTYYAYNTSYGTGASPSTSCNTNNGEDNLIVGCVGSEQKLGTYTEDSDSWTSLESEGPTAGGTASCVANEGGYKEITGSSDTHDPTITSADYGHVVVSWYDASSGVSLTVNESNHAHTSEEVTLLPDLTVDESSHAHVSDEVTLTLHIPLTVEESNHAHVSDEVTLTENIPLTVQESNHAHVSDEVTLIENVGLVVGESNHTHVADEVTLTQVHSLAVDESNHNHISDEVTFVQHFSLSVDESNHSHVADEVTLIENIPLTVNESNHNHIADEVTFTQQHILVVNESNHAHVSDEVTWGLGISLTVNESNHAHVSDEVTFLQHFSLSVDESNHGHTTDEPLFIQQHSLVVNESQHSHYADMAVVTTEGGAIEDDQTLFYRCIRL